MTQVFKDRCQKMMNEFTAFQIKVHQSHPALKSNNALQFTLKLVKRGNWKCQCIGFEAVVLDIPFCKTSFTLLKRLSYLSNIRKLEFSQDSENSNEFIIRIPNMQQKQKFLKKGQLQFLF